MPLFRLSKRLDFPPAWLARSDGLLCVGGDLSSKRLLLAYKNGIFPWFSKDEPILWWSPDPRLVLYLDEFKLRKSLKKRIKHFEIRYDTAFKEVMMACGSVPRDGQEGSWIIPEVIEGYSVLFDMGYAHSIEAWQDGKLVGGLYGICIGKMFYGESMFAKVSDASKVAFADLVERLKKDGFKVIDCQIASPHLESLGARTISRESFVEHLKDLVYEDFTPGHWKKL